MENIFLWIHYRNICRNCNWIFNVCRMNWRYIKKYLIWLVLITLFCAILFLPTNKEQDQNIYWSPEFEDDWNCCTSEQEKKEMLETERKTKPAYIKKLLEH